MAAGDSRWWGARSEFPWEQAALDFIRQQMRDGEPYRAWTTFTFTANTGHVREVDLLVATPAGLFLVEIKSHRGELTNQGSTWMFRDGSHARAIENPLHLTDLKAKELKSQLEKAKNRLNLRGVRIPFVKPAVFLSDPGLRCRLDELQQPGIYLRDQRDGMPAIWPDLLDAGPSSQQSRLDSTLSRQLVRLLDTVGIQGYRRHRTVGMWQLEPKAADAGPTWEDYFAENAALSGDHRRVRIYLSEQGASRQERESTRRTARREYLILRGIDHPGIVKAEQFSHEHDAGPAIIFEHRKDWLRLDHYMAQYGDGLDVDTRLGMIRQLGEALDHAHRRHLYHRALAARSIYVAFHGAGYDPQLKISDWQAASKARDSHNPWQAGTATMSAALRSLAEHLDQAAEPYLAPEFGRPEAESIPLDIFGLGAVAYLILTGLAPASTRADLQRRLSQERGLVPSTVADSISTAMDDLVREATRLEVCDRTIESVRDFLAYLDMVEDELTAPDVEPVADPLEATAGTSIGDLKVVKVLGKGSTARALLVERPAERGEKAQPVVLKAALNDAGAERLRREAELLGRLHDSRIVQLLEGPLAIGGRSALVIEYAGDTSLAIRLRREGSLGIDELEEYGRQLFEVVEYLEGVSVRHRDIKPDNLAIRRLANNRPWLVLFDFSLAGVADSAVSAGTQYYLDPFIGTDRRPVYDDAAEHYAVAVTLHEMASGELPSWGDGITEAHLLDPSEQMPQLAEDRFDPGMREGLAAFFRKALHRDVTKRFDGLRQLRAAWQDIFRALDQSRPPSTPLTTDDDTADAAEERERLAQVATKDTQLVVSGLSARALSVAGKTLGVATVGELIAIPATRIQRLRGVGIGPRNELIRRARDWRKRFQLEESVQAAAKDERQAAGEAPPDEAVDVGERTRQLSLDEVVSRLFGKAAETERRVLEQVLALPAEDGTPALVEPWALQRVIADQLALSGGRIAQVLMAARDRWAADSAVKWLRQDIVDILAANSRVMETSELASELLTRRGSALAAPSERLALGAAAARAAIETEEKQKNPRVIKRRSGNRVLVALCAEDDPSVPSDNDLIDYALQLGRCADELVKRDPLPSPAAVRADLRAVGVPEGMRPQLPDTRLIALAAAASENAAVTARLELYPRDLSPVRAITMAQVVTVLGEGGVRPEELRTRLLARFPDLIGFPESPEEIRAVLKQAGFDVSWSSGRLIMTTSLTTGSRSASPVTPTSTSGRLTPDQVSRRLQACIGEGGFLAVNAHVAKVPEVLPALQAYDNVTLVDVAATFVAELRAVVRERGKPPRWETMLGADPAGAPPVFHQLVGQAFSRLEQQVQAISGIAVLHDATPLAHYTGGPELLARLSDAARTPQEAPHGLWLICPMRDPHSPPLLDELTVTYVTDNEYLELPRDFGDSGADAQHQRGKAS